MKLGQHLELVEIWEDNGSLSVRLEAAIFNVCLRYFVDGDGEISPANFCSISGEPGYTFDQGIDLCLNALKLEFFESAEDCVDREGLLSDLECEIKSMGRNAIEAILEEMASLESSEHDMATRHYWSQKGVK